MEMEQKIQKDEDRRKKIGIELSNLSKDYETAKTELEKLISDKNEI